MQFPDEVPQRSDITPGPRAGGCAAGASRPALPILLRTSGRDHGTFVGTSYLNRLHGIALSERLRSLREQIADIEAEPVSGRAGLSEAHRALKLYPDYVEKLLQEAAKTTSNEEDLATLTSDALQHVIQTSAWIDGLFARGASLKIPLSLFEAVTRHCAAFKLKETNFVLTVGPPEDYNFEASPKDLSDLLFDGFLGPPELTEPGKGVALLSVPMTEGCETLWWPIVLGHELAHLVIKERRPDERFQRRFVDKYTERQPEAERDVFRLKAQYWVVELLCDAYTALRFGPAGAAALAEFLHLVSWRDQRDDIVPTHPPALLRIELMLGWVQQPKTGSLHDMVDPVLRPWRELLGSQSVASKHALTSELIRVMRELAPRFLEEVSRWGVTRYDLLKREAALEACVRYLSNGIPPDRLSEAPDSLIEADVINAGWIARAGESPWRTETLVRKSLDSLVFMSRWKVPEPDAVTGEDLQAIGPAVLSKNAIESALRRETERLVIAPLIRSSIGAASMDIRLGPQFIVFRRTETPAFSSLSLTSAGRKLQRKIEVGWDDEFVLHPGELVLASTLEYLAMPSDLSAQVITRSSYGRLGLITATAVHVHPYFRGCLTLELLNLGQIPLMLRPGERIAQLVFFTVQPPAKAPASVDYDPPIGPKFSQSTTGKQEAESLGVAKDRLDTMDS